jgi:hypothetical protein
MPSRLPRCRRAPWFAAAAFLFLISASAQAGPRSPQAPDAPPSAELVRDLAADDPRIVAWAAYRAGEARRTDAIPALVDTLASARVQSPGLEWGAARDAVLDALIRLDACPPVSALIPHYEARSEAVLILLAEPRAGRDGVLLALLKRESGILWYASAGLLLEDEAPGLAAELLRGLRLTLEVTVEDGQPGDISGSSSTGGIGHGAPHDVKGFPPIATYSFWESPVRGAVVLSGGPRPVYYTRKVCPADAGIPSSGHRSLIDAPTAEDRLALLEELIDHWLPVKAVEPLTIRWTTPQDYRRRIAAARDRLARDAASLIDIAKEEGRLTQDEAGGVQVAIDVRVRDERGRKHHPLPPIEPWRSRGIAMYPSLVVESAIAFALVARLAWSCWQPSRRIGRLSRWLMAAHAAAWIAFLVVSPPVPDEVLAAIDASRRAPFDGSVDLVHDAPTIVAGRYSGTFGAMNGADRVMILFTGPALGYARWLHLYLVPHKLTEPSRGESHAIAAVAFVLSMAFWNAFGSGVQAWRARRRARSNALDPPAAIPAP